LFYVFLFFVGFFFCKPSTKTKFIRRQ